MSAGGEDLLPTKSNLDLAWTREQPDVGESESEDSQDAGELDRPQQY
jgi:hypothetical protein